MYLQVNCLYIKLRCLFILAANGCDVNDLIFAMYISGGLWLF